MSFNKDLYREKLQWIRENTPISLNDISQGMGISSFLLRRFLLSELPLRQASGVKIKLWIDRKIETLKETQGK